MRFPKMYIFGAPIELTVPGIELNFCIQSKNSSVNICVPKMRFPKMYTFGAPIEMIGPEMISS